MIAVEMLLSRQLLRLAGRPFHPKVLSMLGCLYQRGYTSESFADLLLEKTHVAVAPGKGFGPAGDAYVRIGLLVEPERLVEAVNRIANLHLFNN